jgi:hypothetical protein
MCEKYKKKNLMVVELGLGLSENFGFLFDLGFCSNNFRIGFRMLWKI